MTNYLKNNLQSSSYWTTFVQKEQLNQIAQERFAQYLHLLIEWNKQFNITTITDPESIIRYHFQDSLYVRNVIDLKNCSGVCDVGSGGGFPGIPLAICYPEVKILLIEVNHKKVQFLQAVIDELKLPAVELYTLDWRTFLRKTSYNIDLFFARASLKPIELLRMFKPICHYKGAILIYWAADVWQPDEKEQPFIQREVPYKMGNKKRKLVFFKSNTL